MNIRANTLKPNWSYQEQGHGKICQITVLEAVYIFVWSHLWLWRDVVSCYHFWQSIRPGSISFSIKVILWEFILLMLLPRSLIAWKQTQLAQVHISSNFNHIFLSCYKDKKATQHTSAQSESLNSIDAFSWYTKEWQGNPSSFHHNMVVLAPWRTLSWKPSSYVLQ